MLPTRITMLYNKSSDLTHFIGESLYLFTSLSLFPSFPHPLAITFTLCSYKFEFHLVSTCRVIACSICHSLSDLPHLA